MPGALTASWRRRQDERPRPLPDERARGARVVALLGVCIVSLCACAQPAPMPTAESIHFSDHLKHIMRRLDTLVYERNLTELEIDRERLRRADALAAAAAELAMEADAVAPAQAADATQRQAFARHAQALASAAARLDQLATAGDHAAVASQMRVVEDQCTACHQYFGVRTP